MKIVHVLADGSEIERIENYSVRPATAPEAYKILTEQRGKKNDKTDNLSRRSPDRPESSSQTRGAVGVALA